MTEHVPVAVSPALRAALDRFDHYLISDDSDRGEAVSRSDTEMLRELVDAVTPLYDEVNSILDVLVAQPHPMPEDQEALEYRLNDLAQSAEDARIELDSRG